MSGRAVIPGHRVLALSLGSEGVLAVGRHLLSGLAMAVLWFLPGPSVGHGPAEPDAVQRVVLGAVRCLIMGTISAE